jgi:nitroreductase
MKERARLVASNVPEDAETLYRLMAERFSCRAFLPDPVPDSVVHSIVDSARLTASWCNTQPWHMIITRPDTTEPFRQSLIAQARESDAIDSDLQFPTEYRNQYLARRRAAGYALHEAVGIVRGDMEARERQSFENFRFFGAPHVAIVTTAAELGPYAAVDCGGFVANFLLAAQAHGISTIPQAALAKHAGFIRRYFGIAEDRLIVCGISFGYADLAHPVNAFRTARESADDIFRFA